MSNGSAEMISESGEPTNEHVSSHPTNTESKSDQIVNSESIPLFGDPKNQASIAESSLNQNSEEVSAFPKSNFRTISFDESQINKVLKFQNIQDLPKNRRERPSYIGKPPPNLLPLEKLDLSDKNITKNLIINNQVISIPIHVSTDRRTRSFTMIDPESRFRTYSEIVLVQNHPEYLRNISDFHFLKEIGSGGFGTVWLTQDLRTGKKCAVKELKRTELKGSALKNFMREIHTMIISQTRFICPIAGYTIEPPYSIITQYHAGGTLHENIVRKKLDGTQLTIIFMCIAHAMSYVHRCGVLHRDLKNTNVLIDEDGLPQIIDFGVARLMNSENKYTKQSGTISHMAPEVILGKEYDTKADVFSYSTMLYEASEMRKPYSSANRDYAIIAKKITSGFRPKFIGSSTPKPLKNLIVSCWQDDPTKRPSFETIFQIFAEGKTLFKGANANQVVKFAKEILIDDAVRLTSPPPPKTEPIVDTDAVITRLTRKLTMKGPLKKTKLEIQAQTIDNVDEHVVEKIAEKPVIRKDSMEQINAEIENIPMPQYYEDDKHIKMNPDDPRFNSFIEYQVENIEVFQFPQFYQIISPYIIYSCDVTKIIITNIVKLINKNEEFLDKIYESRFVSAVNVEKNIEDEMLEILANFFIKRPNFLNGTFNRLIAYFINHKPNDILALYSIYVHNLEAIEDPFPILDFLRSYARIFLNINAGVKFIDLFYYLIKEYLEFQQSRVHIFRPIFTAFARSDLDCVVATALKAIFDLYDDSFQINLKVLLQYVSNPNLSKYSLAVIERINDYPKSKSFVISVGSQCDSTKIASNILLKFASLSHEHASLLSTSTHWMKSKGEHNARIFLYLFSIPELRKNLSESPYFPQFLVNTAKLGNSTIVEFIGAILRRIEVTPELLDKLEELKFFIIMIHATKEFPTTTKCVIELIETVSKVKYLSSYSQFIPLLMQQLSLHNELTFTAISGFVLLSYHKELIPSLSIKPIVDYFTQLSQVESQKEHAKSFLSNVLQELD
ncbi:hypothetical protein TRFO_09728 [Tritrichomonas foetus]|uniref:Protein kinase domain-containing protein n=1 Tax=Tritrichomonas foetus TaxID=1144522 RepID=A0A1J4JCC8_9EUKA|nr:hypothetical protein TRFO_09728 [Tritrichomonas foetus]|eukprot:OHS96838.1 hypothetical protein TRFO_09728 [Tritrichomonas foetus]